MKIDVSQHVPIGRMLHVDDTVIVNPKDVNRMVVPKYMKHCEKHPLVMWDVTNVVGCWMCQKEDHERWLEERRALKASSRTRRGRPTRER